MENLLFEYRQTKKETVVLLESIKEEIALLRGKIDELPRRCIAKKLKLREQIKQLENEKSIVSSWISNLDYSIRWMNSGMRPGSTRGAERRAAYEREKPFDPMVMQRYFRSTQPEYPWDNQRSFENIIDTDERELIEYAMQDLTEKEKEIYMLARGKCMSQYKIADMFYVSRNTIKTTLSRAQRKISKRITTYNERRDA